MPSANKLLVATCFATLAWGCSDDGGSASTAAIEKAWAMSIGDVSLKANKESKIEGGKCRAGTVSGLAVELCTFKDTVSADSARDVGLAQVGSHTGVALVRETMLLIASDPQKVDVHGKKLNQLSKDFLDTGAAGGSNSLGL